jgi:hypothetical protein
MPSVTQQLSTIFDDEFHAGMRHAYVQEVVRQIDRLTASIQNGVHDCGDCGPDVPKHQVFTCPGDCAHENGRPLTSHNQTDIERLFCGGCNRFFRKGTLGWTAVG